MEHANAILRASNIHKTFLNPAKVLLLKGIDLTVKKGETVAIMGRSGQGKSTLLNILGTLEQPCEGTLEIAGQSVSFFNKSTLRNQQLGFIFQSFHLLEDYTAIENVLIPARIARKRVRRGSEAYAKGMELLQTVGLADRAQFDTKRLSGGEKQRVAIARALCNDPDIIFADEPSGNLDRQTAQLIHELLLGYVHKYGKTLIAVTHDNELAALCSKCYYLRDGLLVASNGDHL
jgi:lipoprotein-releasing system ATP-binding protein